MPGRAPNNARHANTRGPRSTPRAHAPPGPKLSVQRGHAGAAALRATRPRRGRNSPCNAATLNRNV
eukprot:6486828-Lingulodinium_polyedra.AAC.1